MELLHRFAVAGDDDSYEAYLFRFREYPKDWESGGGWMAAVAGPYHEGKCIGSPWSGFES